MTIYHRYFFTCVFGMCDCEDRTYARLIVRNESLSIVRNYLQVDRSNTERFERMTGVTEEEKEGQREASRESQLKYKKEIATLEKEIEDIENGII